MGLVLMHKVGQGVDLFVENEKIAELRVRRIEKPREGYKIVHIELQRERETQSYILETGSSITPMSDLEVFISKNDKQSRVKLNYVSKRLLILRYPLKEKIISPV